MSSAYSLVAVDQTLRPMLAKERRKRTQIATATIENFLNTVHKRYYLENIIFIHILEISSS